MVISGGTFKATVIYDSSAPMTSYNYPPGYWEYASYEESVIGISYEAYDTDGNLIVAETVSSGFSNTWVQNGSDTYPTDYIYWLVDDGTNAAWTYFRDPTGAMTDDAKVYPEPPLVFSTSNLQARHVDPETGATFTVHGYIEHVYRDSDGDGFTDDEDACINSDLSPTVVVNGKDSGVANTLLADGCTISDLISAAAAGSSSSKEFKKAVSRLLDGLVAEGVLSRKDKSRILRVCSSK